MYQHNFFFSLEKIEVKWRVKQGGEGMKGLLKSKLRGKTSIFLAAMIVTSNFAGVFPVAADTKREMTWDYGEKVSVATFAGQIPEMPDKVYVDGTEHRVTWNVSEKDDFSKEYGTVTVKGTIVGSDKTMEAEVEIIPENLKYFVNCTGDVKKNPFNGNDMSVTSAPYQAIAEFLKNKGTPLLNETGDQLFSQNASWGLEVKGQIKQTPDNTEGTVYDKYGIAWRTNTDDIIYHFTLPAGTYKLTSGLKEMYAGKHTRKVQPKVTYKDQAGDTVSQLFDQITLASDDKGNRDIKTSSEILTLPAECTVEYRLEHAGNEKPMVSWIGISQLEGSTAAFVSGYEARQIVVPGGAPVLPETVTVHDADKTERQAVVTWNSFDVSAFDSPYGASPVIIKGTVADADNYEIAVEIDVIPATLKYFIDCGTGSWGPLSGFFDLVKANNKIEMLNQSSDQEYQESSGSTWGYVKAADSKSLMLTPDGTTGAVDSIYNVGVRTNTGDIVYKMYLPKGTYQFTSGHHEWYGGQTRVFQPVITYEDQEGNVRSVTGDKITMKNQYNSNLTTTNKLELPIDTVVTYTIKYISDSKPVLSFIAVEEDYFSSRTPEHIEVSKLPDKMRYGVGEQLIADGMAVKAYYEGGLVEKAEGYELSGFDSDDDGEKKVTVTYKGKVTTFNVLVDGDVPTYEPLALMAETFLLKGDSTANNAKLFWNPVEGAAGYRVYQTEASGGERKLLETTKSVSLDVYDMEGDTDFVVEAYNAYGRLMEVSNAASAELIEVPDNVEVRSNMPASGTANALSYGSDSEEDAFMMDANEVTYTYKIEKDDQFGTNTAKKLVEYAAGYETGRTVLDGNDNEALKDCKFEGVSQFRKDEKVIIWAHFEYASGYSLAEAACMYGTVGEDDFTLYHVRPQGHDSRDLTMYHEGTDMYLISATNNNSDMNIYKLNDAWTAVLPAEQFPAITICRGEHREAPSMVKVDGWYYLFTSQANDWYPSQGKYCSAKSLSGLAYAPLRAVHTNTYGTQSGWMDSMGSRMMLTGSRWAASGHYGELQNMTKKFPLSFHEGYSIYSYYPEILYNNELAIPVQNGRNLSMGHPIGTVEGDTAAETGVEASYAVDGNCYESDSYYKPKGDAVPYTITVDLGQQCEISQIDLTFRAVKGSDTTNPYKIYGSQDGTYFDTVLVDASDLNAPGFDSREVNADGTYRYVRLVVENVTNIRNGKSASWASGIHEITVYGSPMEIETDYTAVPVGEPWLDNRGATIQAHGGGFLQMTDEDGTPIYYWAGEDKTHNRSTFNGINLYSSKDLVNWRFEKSILKPDPTNPALNNNKIERPKLIYNKNTGRFILWGHWETADSYSSSQICVAVSDTVNGDYEFLGHWRPGGTLRNWRKQGGIAYYENDSEKTPISDEEINADGNLSRDITVYVDGEKAYLVSACANDHSIAIYELNEEFTDVEPGKEYHVLVDQKLEAPAIVKEGEYYYLIGSGQSGWYPNQGRYAFSKEISDPESWSDIQWFANNTTYYSQPTNIMTLTDQSGNNSYVYMGDRWNPQALRDSTYVWLPLEIDGELIAMEFFKEWSLNQESGECVLIRAENLSVGRPVEATAAAKEDRNASVANDGDSVNTKKSGDTSSCYQPSGAPFYWMVDLESEEELSRIDLSFRMYNGSETYHQYKVYGSDDKDEWTELVDESSNKTTGFKSHNLSGTYRYVKVEVSKVARADNGSSASWAAGLVEVTVYGDEIPEKEADCYTQKIKVTQLPDKLDYEVDEEFDPEGMEVTVTEQIKTQSAEEGTAATPGNATRVLGPHEYETEYDFSKAGEQDVTVYFMGIGKYGNDRKFTDHFKVNVLEEGEEAVSYTQKIEVTKFPEKTVYDIGDEFEPEGMEVTEYVRVATPSMATRSSASRAAEIRKRILDEDEYVTEYDFNKSGKSRRRQFTRLELK